MEKYISMLVKDSGFKTLVRLILKTLPKFFLAQHLPPICPSLLCTGFARVSEVLKSALERSLLSRGT